MKVKVWYRAVGLILVFIMIVFLIMGYFYYVRNLPDFLPEIYETHHFDLTIDGSATIVHCINGLCNETIELENGTYEVIFALPYIDLEYGKVG